MPLRVAENKPIKRGRTKRVVGLIAIALIVVFTILGIARVLSFVVWILAELVVALIANMIFRRLDKRSKQMANGS
jgi:Flp pilus assembly protein TadB